MKQKKNPNSLSLESRLHLAYATSLLNHLVSQVDEWSLVRVYREHTHKVHLVTNTSLKNVWKTFWRETPQKVFTA